jgi:pilus assembly protein Flp/PilA
VVSPLTDQFAEGVAMTKIIMSMRDRLHQDDRGATAVEYGLIVALIAAVIIIVVGTVGQDVLSAFNTVVTNW